jgi:hypothetical protein
MTSTTNPAWPVWLFRAGVTAEAVFALAQALLAGGFLGGHYDLLAAHAENATNTGITAIVLVACAVLRWKPGGGPAWPIFAGTGLFLAEAGQIVLGYARVLAVHIPLGVGIIVAIALLLVSAWRTPTKVVAA